MAGEYDGQADDSRAGNYRKDSVKVPKTARNRQGLGNEGA